MRLKSIGARLTLWYTGILSLTLLLLGTMAYGLLTYSLSQDIDAALRGVAQVAAERVRRDGRTALPPDLDELFRRFFGFSPSERYFELRDPLGRHESGRPPSPTPLPVSPKALQNALRGAATFETLQGFGPYPVRVLIMPVLEAGRVVNVVQVGISLENMVKTLSSLCPDHGRSLASRPAVGRRGRLVVGPAGSQTRGPYDSGCAPDQRRAPPGAASGDRRRR